MYSYSSIMWTCLVISIVYVYVYMSCYSSIRVGPASPAEDASEPRADVRHGIYIS